MFQSHRQLKRKTPDQGIDRRAYIGHLIDEYYTTSNVEAQEQVTANLANFAYDPLNWTYLHAADALDLFVTLLETVNETLQLHAIAALCNMCLDEKTTTFLKEPKHTALITSLFSKTEHPDIILQCVTLFLQLLSCLETPSNKVYKEELVTPALLKRIHHWRQSSDDPRVVKICQLFLIDFGRRTEEIIERQNAKSPPPTMHKGASQIAGSPDS